MQTLNWDYKTYYKNAYQVYKTKPTLTASVEIILTIFAVTVMAATAIRPTLQIVAGLQRKIDDQELVNQKITNKIVSLQSAQQALSSHEADIKLYWNAVPDKHDIGGLSRRLELLAQRSNLVINLIDIGEVNLLPKDKVEITNGTMVTKIEILPISISIEGSFVDTKVFLKRLENMDRLLRIETLTMVKKEETEINGTIETNIQAYAYYKTNKL